VGKAGAVAMSAMCPAVFLTYVHFLLGTDALELHLPGLVHLQSVTCDPVGITAGAMSIRGLGHVLQKGALANFVGASGTRAAYRFTAPAADINAMTWMAADGNGATDSLGAFIVRED